MPPFPSRAALAALILSVALLPPSAAAQPTAPPPKYAEAVRRLDGWIAREVEAKGLPSLAIALVDGQQVVWAKGFGWEDAQRRRPATARTLYRVGSVSKPVTALLLMFLVEMGLIDLDAPVSDYLPDFRPKNPYEKKITLRQMLAHRSGLVREPPVGNYFDDTGPTLAQTVQSLNDTALIYEPGKKTAYSNAALAVVGRVIEKKLGTDFNTAVREKLLDPIGMTESSFAPPPVQRKHVADALMWTWHGRTFAAPKFDLGMAPAGSLYSSAGDMAKLLRFLFAGGKGASGPILKKETLETMWKPAFVKPQDKSGFGIGFFVSEFEGRRRIGHGGAVYGFSTEFAALPDDQLGAVVLSARDVSNAVTRRIADVALRHLLAVRGGTKLPEIDETRPVDPTEARRLEGKYQSGKKLLELKESFGKLYYLPRWQGLRMELRRGKDCLITDDLTGYGTKVVVKGDKVIVDGEEFARVPTVRPPAAATKYTGLVGEYGPDHNVLYILEKDGTLYALIEWFFLYPLEEVTRDEFRFPDFGLYHGDKVVFYRDGSGRAAKVKAANVMFERRKIKGEGGETFTVQPKRPLEELRKIARTAKPPVETGKFRAPELVDLSTLDPTLKFDIRYAGTNNFLQTPFYTQAKAYLQKPAAEALVRAHRKLAKEGYGLLIFDAYRPWHVTKMFWDATPEKYHGFVADPSKGSRHNRGCAVDLTLYDLKTGKPVEMVSGFDEFSDRSFADYPGGTSLERWHRDLLRRAMEAEGFSVYEAEWWHFDYRDWKEYPILNLTLEELGK